MITLIILETGENNDVYTKRLIGVSFINNRIIHSPYQMKDEEESTGHDEVVTADAPSASENHDTRHLFFTIVSSSLSSIQSVTIFSDFQRGPRSNRALSSNHRSTRTWTLLRDLFETRNERQSPRRGRRRVPGRAFP